MVPTPVYAPRRGREGVCDRTLRGIALGWRHDLDRFGHLRLTEMSEPVEIAAPAQRIPIGNAIADKAASVSILYVYRHASSLICDRISSGAALGCSQDLGRFGHLCFQEMSELAKILTPA